MSKDKCEFYPTDKELNRSGPFCGAGSDVSGTHICTQEDSKNCQWANEERIRNGNEHNSSK